MSRVREIIQSYAASRSEIGMCDLCDHVEEQTGECRPDRVIQIIESLGWFRDGMMPHQFGRLTLEQYRFVRRHVG